MVTAGLAGSVLNRLDCQAVPPASSSPIELCGVARSKRVSFVIGLQLLVVVFGRRALVGSDPGRIGIRRRAVERRVACVVASVIGLIGPRALNWGFGRSVPIGGSCRDERVSRFDVFSLDQGRDRNLLLGGGLSRGLLTGCEGGDGRELVLTGLGSVRRSSAIVQSLASKLRSRRVPRVFGDQPFSRCGVARRSPAVVQAVLWDRLSSTQPRVGGDHPLQAEAATRGFTPGVRGFDRFARVRGIRMSSSRGWDSPSDGKSCSISVRTMSSACSVRRRCRPLPRVWGDRPPTHPRPEGILILDRTGSEQSRGPLPRSSGDRPLEDQPVRCPGPIPPCTPLGRGSTVVSEGLQASNERYLGAGGVASDQRGGLRSPSTPLGRGPTVVVQPSPKTAESAIPQVWGSTAVSPARRFAASPRSGGDRLFLVRIATSVCAPSGRGSTASGAGGNFGLCPAGAGILRRRGEVGRRVLAVREAC